MSDEQHPALWAKDSAGEAKRPERIVYPENPRYRRIRFLSVLLDQSIVLPNGYQIGLDPILGLIPGIGDGLAAMLSCYLVYESARLGLPKRVLLRMLGNVAVEAAVGSIPLFGDVFDAVWKANMRNLRLLETHYHPGTPERPARRIAVWMVIITGLFLAGIFALLFLMMKLVISLFS